MFGLEPPLWVKLGFVLWAQLEFGSRGGCISRVGARQMSCKANSLSRGPSDFPTEERHLRAGKRTVQLRVVIDAGDGGQIRQLEQLQHDVDDFLHFRGSPGEIIHSRT